MEELQQKIQNLKNQQFTPNIFTLEATVPTGLENIALGEIREKCVDTKDAYFTQGRIYFNIFAENFSEIKSLRSIDNISLVVDIKKIKFEENKDEDLKQIISLLNTLDLDAAAKQWAQLTNYGGNVSPSREEHDEARIKQDKIFASRNENRKIEDCEHNVLKYRVTCERSGGNHSFSSNEAAYKFGGEINNVLNWIVALSDWNLNVLLRIQKNFATVCLKITVESLHRRCLVEFGPTSLRPTIAYSMLRLADIKSGDHVVDPLCGGGSIPIECMYGFPTTMVSCGDIHRKAVERTLHNVQAQDGKIVSPNIFKWDATKLPFRKHEVDVIVSDLPFGKRSGSRKNNSQLYKRVVNEFARVLRLGTGRLVLLTQDAPHLYKALQYRDPKSCWHITSISSVKVGALKCALVAAQRKKKEFYEIKT